MRPTSGEDVIINTLDSGSTLTYTAGTVNLNSLTFGSGAVGTLDVSGGTLTVGGGTTSFSGTLSIDGGTVDFITHNAVTLGTVKLLGWHPGRLGHG